MKRKEMLCKTAIITLLFAVCFLNSDVVTAQTSKKHALKILKYEKPQDYFKYTGDGSVLISGHRGGRETGFPENSIEGFKNVLKQAPAFFEIDPRLTKDSVIVLMHDATLDRTTTGKGSLSDYTWKQLKAFRLKDSDGNITSYQIPTLKKVIKWSKGKTVVNLDKKDVPMEMIVAMIKKLHAEDHVMLTVHNGSQAKYYHDHFPRIMFSAFARTMKEFEDIAAAGVPWENMIAYVGPTINAGNKKIVGLLHGKGVRCMISVAPTHDQLKTPGERRKAYREEINKQPDIIESDIPTEIEIALKSH